MNKPIQSYPFTPKSSLSLRLGDFWPVPLVDGSFACGRVLQHNPDGRVSFFGGLMDWRGDEPPTSDALAGSATIRQGSMHLKAITRVGGQIVGNRPLELEGVEPWLCKNAERIQRGYTHVRRWTPSDENQLPVFSTWGYMFIWAAANRDFLGVTVPEGAEPEVA